MIGNLSRVFVPHLQINVHSFHSVFYTLLLGLNLFWMADLYFFIVNIYKNIMNNKKLTEKKEESNYAMSSMTVYQDRVSVG